MLGSTFDKGCFDFMHSRMGVGVFVAEAGENKVMLHQAANDGFRGLYMICFDGPAAASGARGFVLLSNGDNKAMFLNCEVTRILLRGMLPSGVDWDDMQRRNDFDISKLPQEQIVNLGLKEMVLKAFLPRSRSKL